MSVIGPRPVLWNQDLLTAERDRYGSNDVRPGLTGLAQISGRDELEIKDKARLDGEYARQFNITKLKYVVTGGASGQESIFNGLKAIRQDHSDEDVVIVHGAGRADRRPHVLRRGTAG